MITVNGFEIMDFPAGESFVKDTSFSRKIDIVWNYEDDSELMKLALIKNVVEDAYIALHMPYVPHARQDRATAKGFPFSLKVFVEMLDKIFNKPEILSYYRNPRYVINVVDPHSHVFEELCKQHNLNVSIKRQWLYASHFYGRYDYVVAPDKGAVEKAAQWAAELGIPMIPCSKTRDTATGKLSRPIVPDLNLSEKRLLVVDDIGDGFRTHINLCKKLKERSNNAVVDIFVSHAIFSSGIDNLLENFRNIYTTKSLPHYLKYIDKSAGRLIALDI